MIARLLLTTSLLSGSLTLALAQPSPFQPLVTAPGRPAASTPASVPARAVYHDWNSQSGQWYNAAAVAFQYDARGYLATETRVDSASQAPLRRFLTVYDAAGRLLSVTDQLYRLGAWTDNLRQLYTYNSYGDCTEYLAQNAGPSGWVNNSLSSQYQLTYNAAGVPTQSITRAWSSAGSPTGTYSWQNYSRTLYTLNAAGQWQEIVEQLWQNNAWQNTSRSIDVVWTDWPQRRRAADRSQQWSSGAWVDELRRSYAYQPTGTTQTTTERPSNGSWTPSGRTTRVYDAQGNDGGTLIEIWNGAGWSLVSGALTTRTYNAAGEITRTLFQNLRPAPQNQQLRTYHDYQQVLGTRSVRSAPQLALYPNPATDRATLHVPTPAATACPLTVLNALGQPVLTLTLPAGTATYVLDLRPLPTGLYTVRLLTAAGPVVGRLVKR
ncbi:T9SS type A sorting domain-containing protein [Hymenobacter sp. 15J16-1T3B]|uniref:T9SS type A sorting domain-containing protein n=1 Tax=Hymenobacter sp. 15J16-1T3B TaxID=2886941 RepID=UPI001D128490|nr:T9SS type A sorting domain-containing protein [Hymenobacter sp. 15J16-1T3B]MCC3157871.1 T9SS type A sorting domain-containing protein [Hymenobacter sp. 15J16-1T3B]